VTICCYQAMIQNIAIVYLPPVSNIPGSSSIGPLAQRVRLAFGMRHTLSTQINLNASMATCHSSDSARRWKMSKPSVIAKLPGYVWAQTKLFPNKLVSVIGRAANGIKYSRTGLWSNYPRSARNQSRVWHTWSSLGISCQSKNRRVLGFTTAQIAAPRGTYLAYEYKFRPKED